MLFHVGLPLHPAVSDSGNRGIVVALGFQLHSPKSGIILPKAQIDTYLFLPAEKHHRFASVSKEKLFYFETKRQPLSQQYTATRCPARRESFFLCFLFRTSFYARRFTFTIAALFTFPAGSIALIQSC